MVERDPLPLPDDVVDDIKAFLRIETDDDDALLARLALTAAARAEDFCSQVLITRAVSERLSLTPGTPWHSWRRLTALPVTAITDVALVGVGGVTSALLPDQCGIDIDHESRGWVQITDPTVRGPISVSYVAGLAPSWRALPDAVRHAIVRLVAHLYTSRDTVGDSGPPSVVAAFLRPWRRMRLI